MKDLFGAKGSTKEFADRIRCDRPAQENELIECELLLSKFLQIENDMCRADGCDQGTVTHKSTAKAEDTKTMKIAADESDTVKAEKTSGMSTTTIALIAGGSVLALAIGIAAVKMVSGGKDSSPKKKKKAAGRRGATSSDQVSNKSPNREYTQQNEEEEEVQDSPDETEPLNQS
jgi:hypothetical protein